MIYVVYDLEMTVCTKKTDIHEVIEIGAMKLTPLHDQLQIVDHFQAFVQPLTTSLITPLTTKFTGITQNDLKEAQPFQVVGKQFKSWLGTEYSLCSWGPDDKLQLTRECQRHDMNTGWLQNHRNLQKEFSSMLNHNKQQQVGLKKALEILGLSFVGSHHRALDDARNTAHIFMKIWRDLKQAEKEAKHKKTVRL